MTGEGADGAPSARLTAWIVAFCVVTGAVRLALASRGDLWLDEVISLEAARALASPFDVFGLVADNNHHLNTLWLWLVQDAQGSLAARGLSIVSGAVSIALAACVFDARRPWARIVAAVLFSVSFPLVTYGSEARGYAPMLACGLGALVVLRRALASESGAALLAFGLACCFGFLAHLSFAFFYAAFVGWSSVVVALQGRSVARSATSLARLHALPLVFLACFYSLSLRETKILGAPPRALRETLQDVAALALGLPASSELALAAVVAAATLFVIALVSERRAGSNLWIFFLLAIAVVPAGVLALRPPEFAYPRYFLAPLAAYLLLLASWLGRGVARGGTARWGAVGLAAALVIGNAIEVARFLGPQRGAYRTAVAEVAAADAARPIRYGSDHPYRNGTVVDHYAAQLPGAPRFAAVGKADWASAGPPMWYLRHDFGRAPEPEPFRVQQQRYLYELSAQHPYYGLSGWHWLVYRYVRELNAAEAERMLRGR